MKFKILLIMFTTLLYSSTSSAQVSNESGFSWYNNYGDVINQSCAYAGLLPNGIYYRAFTPWTPPLTYQSYHMSSFKAMIATVPAPESPGTVALPPNYPAYSIYIYDNDNAVFGTHLTNQQANTNYIKRYDFSYPYGSNVQFVDVGSTVTYPSGTGNIYVDLYEAQFNLDAATSQDPPTPVTLLAGHRYWFSVVGKVQSGSEGMICLARTNFQTIPSPLPEPPMTITMTDSQCTNWGRPLGCTFRLSNQDFTRIGEPGNNNFSCNVDESYVNTYGAPYSPKLPSPDCLSIEAPLVTVCCLRGYSGRQAVGLTVQAVLTPTATPTPLPSSTATSTPTIVPPTVTATPTPTKTPKPTTLPQKTIKPSVAQAVVTPF